MKAIRNFYSKLHDLENQFADQLRRVAEGLEPPPKDRNSKELDRLWRDAISSRRRLATFIEDSLKTLRDDPNATGVSRRRYKFAKKDLRTASRRIRLWGRFEDMVSAQLDTSPVDLFDTSPPVWRETEVMDQVIELFLDSMHRVANPTAHIQDDDANALGCHRDIPLPMRQFSKLIGAAFRICLAQRKGQPLRFLDVGSGGGTKILAATTCFDECVGLEYEESTVDTGAKLLSLLSPQKCRLIHGDALAFDDYGDFDVIYFYRPLVNFDKMVALEKRIISQVRPGTVLLVAGGLYCDEFEKLGVHRIEDQIYVAGVSETEALEIYDAAKHMGKQVSGFGRKPIYDLGYWRPIYDVSARNGYFV